MDEVFKVIGVSLFSIFLIIIIKDKRKDIAMLLSIATCIMIITFTLNKFNDIVFLLNNLLNKSSINKDFFYIVIKVIGISYLIEFTKNICVDCGESAIANKVEVAGKVIIFTLSIPLISALISCLNEIL